MNLDYFRRINFVCVIIAVIVLILSRCLKIGNPSMGFEGYALDALVMVSLLVLSFFSNFVMFYTTPFLIIWGQRKQNEFNGLNSPDQILSIITSIVLLILFLIILNYVKPKKEFTNLKWISLYMLLLGLTAIQTYFFLQYYGGTFTTTTIISALFSCFVSVIVIFAIYTTYKKYIVPKLSNKLLLPLIMYSISTFFIVAIGYFINSVFINFIVHS